MSNFKAIVAMSQNRAIGKDNKLFWHFRDDLQHFKKMTLNGNVIFGRKTWDGMLIKWLKDRNLWIMTRKNPYGWLQAATGNKYFPCVVNIVENPQHLPQNRDYWVAGGAEVYSLFLDKISEIYVTLVKKEYPEADAFMPPFEHLFSEKEILNSNENFDIIRYYARKPSEQSKELPASSSTDNK